MANKTIDQLTAKANPVDADLLVIADSQDNNEMKQITIGSITADIGDGLIVDGSSSLTTTYSSTKIAADNATQDAALTAGLALKVSKAGDTMTGQLKLAKGADIASATTTDLGAATGNYVDVTGTTTITGLGTVTAGTTVTVRFTGILTLTYNATSLILPTGASITTAAGDVAIFTSLGSGNWRCTSYTRFDGTSLGAVNITSLTEDTTGDMDADFALVYDTSAGANRKQKVNVYRATSGDITTGTTTTKFPSVAQVVSLLNNSSGTSSKNLADASGTQTFAHGLGRIPKYVKITAAATAGTANPYAPFTVYDGTTQSSLSYYGDGSSFGYRSATGALLLGDAITARYQSGVVTFDSTNITITWTKIGSPTGTLPLIWEAQ